MPISAFATPSKTETHHFGTTNAGAKAPAFLLGALRARYPRPPNHHRPGRLECLRLAPGASSSFDKFRMRTTVRRLMESLILSLSKDEDRSPTPIDGRRSSLPSQPLPQDRWFSRGRAPQPNTCYGLTPSSVELDPRQDRPQPLRDGALKGGSLSSGSAFADPFLSGYWIHTTLKTQTNQSLGFISLRQYTVFSSSK